MDNFNMELYSKHNFILTDLDSGKRYLINDHSGIEQEDGSYLLEIKDTEEEKINRQIDIGLQKESWRKAIESAEIIPLNPIDNI